MNSKDETIQSKSSSKHSEKSEMDQFVYAISHDLKAPLRAIVGFSGLLSERMKQKLTDEEARHMEIIVDSAQRMQLMIDALTTFSRLRSRAPNSMSVDLNDVVKRVLRSLAPQIQSAEAKITTGDLPTVQFDPDRAVLLFECLLKNAILYQQSSQPQIEIQSCPIQSDTIKGWEISITDNGIGIDSNNYDRIFGVFDRLHTQEEFPGIGMGLCLAQRIIADQGGELSVTSERGTGSTFRFTILEL